MNKVVSQQQQLYVYLYIHCYPQTLCMIALGAQEQESYLKSGGTKKPSVSVTFKILSFSCYTLQPASVQSEILWKPSYVTWNIIFQATLSSNASLEVKTFQVVFCP